MVEFPNVLWLCVNPSLKPLDQPLLKYLNQQAEVRCWDYAQTSDEPCCFETVLTLLHDYLKQCPHPVHLVGHSLSGAVGLLYAARYPERVQSLTLLSVGINPAVSWHAHYYAMRGLLPCAREIILRQMVRLLFGAQSHSKTLALASLLAQVLDNEITPHSLAQKNVFATDGADVPLLVCCGAHDNILDLPLQAKWQRRLKPSDRFWQCAKGRHFFHYSHAQRTSRVILDFWRQITAPTPLPLIKSLPMESLP